MSEQVSEEGTGEKKEEKGLRKIHGGAQAPFDPVPYPTTSCANEKTQGLAPGTQSDTGQSPGPGRTLGHWGPAFEGR